MDDNTYDFDLAKAPQTIIKVIGVGGGGGNAVSNMYREGIRDVSFVLCNTDNQALQKSEVPNKLLIGQNTTHGLGSGNVPEVGEKAALESEEDIYRMLDDGTRMAFVTAGMGGGTGTGAGPVVAKISKDMGILTVGIVTIPFVFEGRPKIVKALRGVRNMAQNVDSLLVINNERLRNFADMPVPQANRKADETLTIAAKSIAEIVTTDLEQNVDFADVDTTMRNSGVALISIGFGEGEGRLRQAITEALESTLVNDVNNIFNAKRVAFVIYYSHEDELRVSEMDGFGLEDILTKTEQQELVTEEQLREMAEKEEAERKRRAEEDALMGRYYGEYIDSRPNAEIVVFAVDELDDDALISFMEDKPAYKRTAKDVQQIRRKGEEPVRTQGMSFTSPAANQNKKPKSGGTVISFR